MPRYFFDIQDGDALLRDEHGIECPDRDDIRRTALRILPDIAREEVSEVDRRIFKVIAHDGSGRTVFVETLVLTGEWMADPR